tara:strand:- start:21 stop:488 length:468 start_codon:yes stop_codon:yes gene_type:complete
MKLTKSQLKQIIKEEITKVTSVDDLYLAEMFDTASAEFGAEVGAMSLEDKKAACRHPDKWVEGGVDERGVTQPGGFCKKASLTEEDSSAFHACASHVSPKGSDAIGEVIDHTLTEDGTVEYYNVKFGSRIIEGIPAADLDIIKERHHNHKKKGKK